MGRFDRLRHELRREWARDHQLADKVARKWARLDRHGRLVRCLGSPEDRREGARSVGKLIYDSEEQALGCAREMRERFGNEVQRAYRCDRSRHGHFHLTRQVAN